MSEEEKRMKRCCFTGHRPEKLQYSEEQVKSALSEAISNAYADGFSTFITGMARGVDIWAAELVLALKAQHPEIRLICALPHPDFEMRWKAEWQYRYRAVLSQSDLVQTICPAYSKGAYQKRNEWMVDHSARLIAVFNGEPGGTRNTIAYAKMTGVMVVNVDNIVAKGTNKN